MITAFITLSPTREIVSINQSLEGAARHAYGMGMGKLEKKEFNYANIAEALASAPSIAIDYKDGTYVIERHFIAA